MSAKDWTLVKGDANTPGDALCWEQNIPDDDEGRERSDATCMLPAFHKGPHEFTPDDQIVITIKADPS